MALLQQKIERHGVALGVLIAIVISIGGLVEVVPLYLMARSMPPAEGIRPYPALALAGRDVYVREGCYGCHSQMIRTLPSETARYGAYSRAGESVYDRPFQFGSKRTGPDLARIGGRYTDEWQRRHLLDPRAVVPDSNMPAYPWLAEQQVDPRDVERRVKALQRLGDPYSAADLQNVSEQVQGRSEMDALIAYLQGLGVTAPH
jgi:cytochrome c oxidase cbb3-type subunit II